MNSKNDDAKTTGGCLCGAVRYEIKSDLRIFYSINDELPKYQKRWGKETES